MGQSLVDRLNSGNTEENKMSVLENSNKLRGYDINDITRVFKSGDFLALNDPLKIKNLEMYGIDNNVTDRILVAEINDRKRGHKVYQFVNTSDSNGLKRGDILTLDPDKEGKENQTEFDEDFVQYCIELVKKGIPNIETVTTPDKLMEALGLKTYEDIIYMAARKSSVEKQISDRVRTIDDKRKLVEDLGADTSKAKDENDASLDEERDEEGKTINAEEEQEGMTIEEASEVLGIEKEKLREIAGDNGKILGVKKTSDIDSLSRQLGFGMSNAGSEVIMLKVAGPGIKNEGFVLNTDGSPVFSKENGDTTLITELVEDGANGDAIEDIDRAIREHDAESKKIETIDPLTGKKSIEFAEEGNENAIAAYEQESNLLLQQLKDEIQKILDGNGKDSEKLTEVSNKLFMAKGQLIHLQEAYNITENDKIDEIEQQAKDTSGDAEVEKNKENIEGVLRATGKTIAGVAAGVGATLIGNTKDDKEDDDQKVLGPKNAGKYGF